VDLIAEFRPQQGVLALGPGPAGEAARRNPGRVCRFGPGEDAEGRRSGAGNKRGDACLLGEYTASVPVFRNLDHPCRALRASRVSRL